MPECKKVFFCHVFGFGVFFSLCFCAFVLHKIAQNGYFPAFLEVFCLFCSHKRPILNCLFSSYFVFLLLSSLSKSIFSLLFVHNPLVRKDSLCSFFFCLPFPFLRFACLFETNFPNIPFLKPKLLSLLAVSFFSVVLVFVFMV